MFYVRREQNYEKRRGLRIKALIKHPHLQPRGGRKGDFPTSQSKKR